MSGYQLDPNQPQFSEALTHHIQQTLVNMLSDWSLLPNEFKAGVPQYLEINPPLLPITQIFGFHTSVFPVGFTAQYFGDSDPDEHWMILDNRLLDRTAYPAVFAVVGFNGSYPTPGVDPGGNQFYLPEGRGAVLVGKGTHADVNALGKSDGGAVANRTPKHNSTKSGSASLSGSVDGGTVDAFNHTGGSGSSGAPPGSGDRSIVTLAVGNGSLAVSDSISVGPGGSRPTDTPAFTVANHIMFIG